MRIGPVIKPKTGHNRFCGPGALSMILQIDTAEAAKLLRKVSGKQRIAGTHVGHMKNALRERGCRVVEVPVRDTPTLAEWLRLNPISQRSSNIYLITAGTHFVVVQGRLGGCNQTGGPGPLSAMKKRRARVSHVIRIEPPTRETRTQIAHVARLKPFASMAAAQANLDRLTAERKVLDQKISDAAKRFHLTRAWLAQEGQRQTKAAAAAAKRKAEKLAAEHGIEIEIDRVEAGLTHYWVTGPESAYPDDAGDPYEGDHIGTDWDDVLDRVETYVADLKRKQA
jgi:hypothetical protein